MNVSSERRGECHRQPTCLRPQEVGSLPWTSRHLPKFQPSLDLIHNSRNFWLHFSSTYLQSFPILSFLPPQTINTFRASQRGNPSSITSLCHIAGVYGSLDAGFLACDALSFHVGLFSSRDARLQRPLGLARHLPTNQWSRFSAHITKGKHLPPPLQQHYKMMNTIHTV
ncbi:hypothetical protein KJ359_005601 [Pestalotiopsis sp. 9143b]|nr:hypothetical protein KJ359_005601 [Pestalotiopsis sp. 9143b]